MRKDLFRLMMLAGAIVFAILYGMELASKGIANVNGPLETPAASDTAGEPPADDEWRLPERTGTATGGDGAGNVSAGSGDRQAPAYDWGDDEAAELPRKDSQPIVDRLSGATAELLSDLSRGGIRFVVSLFDSVAD